MVCDPSNEIPENILCEEQIISYDKGEGFFGVTNNHENDTITIKKGTCLVQIQVLSENDLNKWENSKRNLVNGIKTSNNKYPLAKSQL